MSRGVDGEAVDQLLHREIFKLLEGVRIQLLDHENEPAGASGVCPRDAGIKFNRAATVREH